jgi:hypothetical protein
LCFADQTVGAKHSDNLMVKVFEHLYAECFAPTDELTQNRLYQFFLKPHRMSRDAGGDAPCVG